MSNEESALRAALAEPVAQLPDADDPRVAAVHAVLVSDIAFPPDEYEAGDAARRIVAAIDALDEPVADAEPVAWRIDFNGRYTFHAHNAIADYRAFDPAATSTPLYAAKQPKAEPVAERVGHVRIDSGEVHFVPRVRDADASSLRDGQALYAAPQPAQQPLTDVQINRHAIAAGEFPPSSQVILVNSLRKLIGGKQ